MCICICMWERWKGDGCTERGDMNEDEGWKKCTITKNVEQIWNAKFDTAVCRVTMQKHATQRIQK